MKQEEESQKMCEENVDSSEPQTPEPTYTVVWWNEGQDSSLPEMEWLRDEVSVPLLSEAEYITNVEARNRWPHLFPRRWMNFANPDLVIMRGDEQIAMLEVTQEVQSAHNALQRFERIYRAGSLGLCTLYLQRIASWIDGKKSRPAGLNLRMTDGIRALESLFPNCSALFIPNDIRGGLTPWLPSSHSEAERRANFELNPNTEVKSAHVRNILTTLLEGLEDDLSLSEANALVRASPTHTTLLANVQTFIDHWEHTARWQSGGRTYREHNSLPPGRSVTILPPDETDQHIQSALADLGLTPQNVVRYLMGGRGRLRTEDRPGDPYAGAALCYRSLYLDNHQREGVFVMYFPDVSIDVYNSLLGASSQNKAMRLYPIAADIIVFSDGYVDTRQTTM